MESGFGDIQKEYMMLLHGLYFSSDFNANRGYTLVVDYGCGRISWGGRAKNTVDKYLVSDFDGVINRERTPSIFRLYIENHVNPEIKNDAREILSFAKEIGVVTRTGTEQQVQKKVDELENVVASYNLTWNQHVKSSIRAAKKLRLTPKLRESFHKIKRLGYTIAFNSGSHRECILSAIKMKDLPVRHAFASIWNFENNAFSGIDHNLRSKKVDVMRELLSNGGFNLFKMSLFMTDDPKSDFESAFAVGMAIHATDDSKLYQKVYDIPSMVRCSNPKELVDLVKKWDILNVVCLLRPLEHELELYERLLEINDIVNKNWDGNPSYYKRRFIDLLNRKNERLKEKGLLDLLHPVHRRDTLNVNKMIAELRFSDDAERNKSLMIKILNRIARKEPLAKAITDGRDLKEFETKLRELALRRREKIW